MDVEYSYCMCGALTVFMPDGSSYSCKKRNKSKYLRDIDLRGAKRLQTSYCCDHCVNHYGLDLCGCGCGNPIGKCEGYFAGESVPMQVFGKYTHVRAADAWF